jgi:zinc transport system ATP-binding protein
MKTGVDDIITCENASFGYDGHAVIRGITLSIPRGGYFCIVGENGSGKSTLIKGFLGLISPMEGTIRFGAGIKRTETGYLSQQAAAKKDFPAGVREIVLSGNLSSMGLRPFYTRAEKQKAEENMRRLGIAGLGERCYRELSGGQQRRVLLARALCAGKKLLVLDEPASGLDPLVTAEMYKLLKSINREMGITVVMVSHDIEAAKIYADEIINLGKPLFDVNAWRRSND